jgi:hypothetical protein
MSLLQFDYPANKAAFGAPGHTSAGPMVSQKMACAALGLARPKIL